MNQLTVIALSYLHAQAVGRTDMEEALFCLMFEEIRSEPNYTRYRFREWQWPKKMYCSESDKGKKMFEVAFDGDYLDAFSTFEEALHYDFSGCTTHEERKENETLEAIVELMCM